MSRKQTKHQSFLDRYLAGKVRREEIDDYVDAWHENPEQMELHEFLGMSKQEYAQWLRNPDALDEIALARKRAVEWLETAGDHTPDGCRTFWRERIGRPIW